MKNIIIAAALLLAACCPQRKTFSNITNDSIRVVSDVEYIERVRDTVIYVNLPTESREKVVFQDSSVLETSAARSRALINPDGSLFHSLENKQLSIPAAVKVKDTSVKQVAESDKIITQREEIPVRMPLRWYEKTLFYCGIAGLCFVIGLTAARIIKRRQT